MFKLLFALRTALLATSTLAAPASNNDLMLLDKRQSAADPFSTVEKYWDLVRTNSNTTCFDACFFWSDSMSECTNLSGTKAQEDCMCTLMVVKRFEDCSECYAYEGGDEAYQDYRSACSSVRSSSSSTTSTTRLATFPTPAFTFDTKATLTLSNGIVTTLDLPSIQAPPTAGIPWTGSYSSGGQVNGDPTDTTSSVTSRETTTLRSDPGTGAAGLVRVEIGWLVGVVVGGAMVGTWVV